MATKRTLWTKADVRCPFYIYHEAKIKSISCEGFDEDSSVILRFKSLGRRDEHMGRCCVEKYESCPMYRCTFEAKYRD